MSAQIPDAFASAFNPVDFDPNAFDPAEAFNSMFELMDGMSNAIIIQVAMDEELAPFLKVTEELQPSFTEGRRSIPPALPAGGARTRFRCCWFAPRLVW